MGYVFATVALPFPIASIRAWRDVRPSRIVRVIAGGRVCLNATQMATFRTGEPALRVDHPADG